MRIPRGLKKRLEDSLENLSPLEAARLHQIYIIEANKKGIAADDYPPRKELLQAWDQRLARSRGKPEEPQVVDDYNALAYLRNVARSAFDVLLEAVGYTALSATRNAWALLFLLHQDAVSEAARFYKARVADEFPLPVGVEDYDRLLAWLKTDALETVNDVTNTLLYAIARADGEAEGEVDEAEGERLFDELVAKVEAGELVGGPGVWTNDLDRPVLIEEGKIPAWVALRLVWRNYVRSRGLRVYDSLDLKPWSPDRVARVGLNGEPLDDKALLALAGDFYKDCRRRPWGKGLAPKPDLDDLVKLLTQSPNPFLHLKPFDFGAVDFEAFALNELDDDGEPYEFDWVAKVASLDALPEDFRRGEVFGSIDFYRDRYYPTTRPEERRADLARVGAMFDRLDTTRQPFTYDRAEEGEMTLSEFMGVEFVTAFEQSFNRLRQSRAEILSLRLAEKRISDRYFGGLPVLLDPSPVLNNLKAAEDFVETVNGTLAGWLEALAKWPWKIDLAPYRLDDVEPDEEVVEETVKLALHRARTQGGFSEAKAAAIERSLGIS